MNLPKNQSIVMAGVGAAALLLVGLAVIKQKSGARNGPAGAYPVGPGQSVNPTGPDPGRRDGGIPERGVRPPNPPVQPPSAVSPDTIDAVVRRISEAPESKYPRDKKEQLRTLLRKAQRVDRLATVSFDVNKKEIQEPSREVLAQLQRSQLNDFNSEKDTYLIVVGYASPDGPAGYNLKLAEQRAAIVESHLDSQLGLEGSRIREVSVGETEILDGNNLNNNRAVEVWHVKINPHDILGF